MSDTVREPSKCIECGAPARLAIGAEDVYSAHCSNECAIQAWNRDVERGLVTCVGELTVEEIDERLSTTGISFDEETFA